MIEWILLKLKGLLYYGCWTAVIVFVVGVVLLYFFQNNIIYIPGSAYCYEAPGLDRSPDNNPRNYRNPLEQKMPYEDLNITTEDGVSLHGWFVPHDNRKTARTVVYYHENAGNIGTRINLLREFHFRAKVNVALVAYRGFSNSQGKPSEEGIKKDSLAILSHVLNNISNIDRTKVYLYGRSLGGAVAVYVATHSPEASRIRGVILENTFTSMADMVDAVLGRLSFLKHFILRNHWKSKEIVHRVRAPILFIKARLDELVPFHHMNTLNEKVKKEGGSCSEYIVEEGTHNETWNLNPEEYFREILSFFDQCEAPAGDARAGEQQSRLL